MTDDVMSDCVGGDYIIENMPKNGEIGGANSSKGIEPRTSPRYLNESLECLLLCLGIFWPEIIPIKI